MSEVEQLAQEQFNTFRNRLCEMLSEIEEEYKSTFIQGYAKRETEEKFRNKQRVEYDYNNEVAKEYTTLQEQITELEKENAELKEVHESDKRSLALIAKKGTELEKELKAEKEYNATLRKEIDEYTNSHTLCAKYKQLEKKISILLSCKNCPENKGGYICEKEYEGKCLSQKTQYIKELQEENAKLKEKLLQEREDYWGKGFNYSKYKLNETKEIIKLLLEDLRNRSYEPVKDIERAEQFLKE